MKTAMFKEGDRVVANQDYGTRLKKGDHATVIRGTNGDGLVRVRRDADGYENELYHYRIDPLDKRADAEHTKSTLETVDAFIELGIGHDDFQTLVRLRRSGKL